MPSSPLIIHAEQTAFLDMQFFDSSCITRSLQALVDDACSAWRLCDHRKGVKGHRSTGLSIALDGSEDHLVSRDAGEFWWELNMAELRALAIKEVDDKIASGAVGGFEDWQKLIFNPRDSGVRGGEGDGTEFEGSLEPGEAAWVTEEDKAIILSDNVAVLTEELRAQIPKPEDIAPYEELKEGL